MQFIDQVRDIAVRQVQGEFKQHVVNVAVIADGF
ncbi:Uncharacterised protein [Enterobacter cloacae]|nr:Uncharacterised protein [Enterobacter cloacae]